ncbi:hypothetical protein [Melittangium boletus]|uniref:hypothetical protein n=1 Tax=Melittangium boletus TaxID=83453 RepID=UPI003DA270A9
MNTTREAARRADEDQDMDMDSNHLNFRCSWQSGIDVRPGFKNTLGYLLDWSGCGGLALKQDIEVPNPLGGSGSEGSIKCVGLISTFRYTGGPTDPIRIKAYVSAGTAAELRTKLADALPNPKLKLAWHIIGFDENDQKWFKSAYLKSAKTAEASIDSEGGKMQIFIASHAVRVSKEIDINLYGFEFQVVPASKKTCMLEFANGTTLRLVKQWGSST